MVILSLFGTYDISSEIYLQVLEFLLQDPTYHYNLATNLKKMSFRGSKLLRKFRKRKMLKIVNVGIKKENDETN